MKDKQFLANLDQIIAEKDALDVMPAPKDWEKFSMQKETSYGVYIKPMFFYVKQNGNKLAQKYNIDEQSELAAIISELNTYFTNAKANIAQQYDKELYRLSFSLRQNQICVPANFAEDVKKLNAEFPSDKNTKKSRIMPYSEQIQDNKFEMVLYICSACLLYGMYEYALDNREDFEKQYLSYGEHISEPEKQKRIEQNKKDYADALNVLNHDVEICRKSLLPAMQQPNFQQGQKHSPDVHALKKLFARCWYDLETRTQTTKGLHLYDLNHMESGYHFNLYQFLDPALPVYDRIVNLADTTIYAIKHYNSSYFIYPVIELVMNAVGPEVQQQMDCIKKYTGIENYVKHRAAFMQQCLLQK